jgi:signal transduction histidine kinase
MLLPERFRAVHRQHVERFAAGDMTSRPMGERRRPIYGRRKSGEEFPADAAISQFRIEGTTILTVALRDITEQKRFEQEQALLSEMGAVLANTLEVGPTLTSIGRLVTRNLADACIVYAVKEDGEVLRLEVVMRDPALGWIGQALARRAVDRSRAPELWAELEANRSVLIAHVSPELRESSAQGDDDRRAIAALAAQSVIVTPLVAHGRLVGAMSLLSCDPSRPYEPVDVRFAEQIAQRAALAIENAKLYDDARRAIQSRDDVLGVVAHDLRNPLGTLRLQATLLERSVGDPQQQAAKAAGVIGRATARMDRLIQDLLDVVRLEQRGLTVEKQRVGTAQVIRDAVAAQEAMASAASLDLALDVPADLPDVWADRDRLLQIFENLIGNAFKFTKPGGIVTVGAAATGGEVLFWVRDTGIGMSADDVPRVFDRFWQARKGGRRGAGLGLPIVKGLVEAHGGRIWVESAVGQGSTFFFTIPTAPQPAGDQGEVEKT